MPANVVFLSVSAMIIKNVYSVKVCKTCLIAAGNVETLLMMT